MLNESNGKEHERLINDIYVTRRSMYACEYDGKPLKALWYKWRLKRLEKKEEKMMLDISKIKRKNKRRS